MKTIFKKVLGRSVILRTLVTRLRVKAASRKTMQSSGQTSFSQVGEDLVVKYLMQLIKIERPSYLDIGAFHPIALSNTYRFYCDGSRGVCVEPDPERCSLIAKHRPRDLCLNVGVGVDRSKEADFYVMTSADLCTFSKAEAERLTMFGQKIERVIRVPLCPINDIIEQYCKPWPNFISLDIEGLDLLVLNSLNFDKYRPEVICVETLDAETQQQKNTAIANLLFAKGYKVFADTFINTIFVRSELMDKHSQ